MSAPAVRHQRPLLTPIVLHNEGILVFSEHFAFKPHALVNFVGAGGKTTLIHKLMTEFCPKGPALYTTTTRIHPPEPREGLVVISSDNLPLLRRIVERVSCNCPDHPYKMIATRHFMSPNLLRGVPPDFTAGVDNTLFPILLNEADGAAGYSIKLPRDGEPVLMEGADYMVPVIGLDCLGQPLGPEVLFRWHPCAEQFLLRAGECITPALAAGILMHKLGVCKGWMPEMTIIPFINKVDEPAQDTAASDLAQAILHNGNFPVERVVFGSVLKERAFSVTVA
jgi:probable selenium-dependent hydroxylase accessory protein YqeC